MKNILTTAMFSVCCCAFANAQCDKKSVLTSSKTEFLNGSNELQQTKDEAVTINFDKGTITIDIQGDHEEHMTGEIKSNQCNWSDPYKQGSSVMKVAMTDHDNVKNATMTLEGKDGVVTLLVVLDDEPERRIKVKADSFKESL